jgi:hypothetical protein
MSYSHLPCLRALAIEVSRLDRHALRRAVRQRPDRRDFGAEIASHLLQLSKLSSTIFPQSSYFTEFRTLISGR